MKRFCLYVAAFAVVLSPILAGGIAFKCRYVPRHIDWSLPSGTRILLAGASHIQCDIDDSLIPGAVNIARSSERYLFTWLKLSRYFAANPELAAVVLQCAPTDLWEHSDDKYFSPNEMSTYIPNFFHPVRTRRMARLPASGRRPDSSRAYSSAFTTGMVSPYQ